MSSPEKLLKLGNSEADEQKALDYEVQKFLNRLRKFNQHSKYLKIGEEIKINVIRAKQVQALPWWAKLFKKSERQ